MIMLAHNGRFGRLKNELENNYTKGKDEYPDTFDQAYAMLHYRVEETKKTWKNEYGKDDGMIFVTHGDDSDVEEETEGN